MRRARTRRLPNIMGLGGAVAGFLAGIVMIVLSPVLSLLTGIGIWVPPKMIAATVLGTSVAQTPGFELAPIMVGGALHHVTSVVLALIFGLVFNRVFHVTTDFGTPLLLGLCYGLLIFVLAYAEILPMITPMLGSSWVAPLVAQTWSLASAWVAFTPCCAPDRV